MNRRIIQVLKTNFEGSITAMARKLDVAAYTIQHIHDLDQNPTIPVIVALHKKLGLSLEWLFGFTDVQVKKTGERSIDILNANQERIGSMIVTRDQVGGDLAKCEYFALRVQDDTCAPLVPPDSVVVIDCTSEGDHTVGLWAIEVGGVVALRYIKLNMMSAKMHITAPNPVHKIDDHVGMADVRVLGRAVWMGARL